MNRHTKWLIYIATSMLMTALMCGCGHSPAPSAQTEPTADIQVIDEQPESISLPTKSEILDWTWEDTRDYMESSYPSFRTAFHIEEDKVLTEDDWLLIKNIFLVSLFGEGASPEEVVSPESIEQDEIITIVDNGYEDVDEATKKEIEDYLDYGHITREYVRDMSTSKFAKWFLGYTKWATGESVDITDYEISEIMEIQESLANELPSEEPAPTPSYMPVPEGQ